MSAPRQTNLERANPYRTNSAFRLHFPVEGVVVKVHFPDDLTSISKREIEYDVQPSIIGLDIIRNAPLAMGLHGIVDDEEVILQPARAVFPVGNFDITTHGPAIDTDGDRVIVQFINGSFANPVITGVLSHPQRARKDKVPPQYTGQLEVLTPGPTNGLGYVFGDGSPGSTEVNLDPKTGNRFRHHKINGTHLALDGNGDVFVNFDAHPDATRGIVAGAVTKKLVIQNEGKDLLRLEIDPTGKLILNIGETLTNNILVNFGDGSMSATIAEYLETMYGDMKSAFDGHNHPAAPGILDSLGMPCSGNTAAPSASFPTWDSQIASTKVKLPDV